MARISTHVLDTSRGLPAAGIIVELHTLRSDGRAKIATAVTNPDGRTDEPLLSSDHLEPGVYELTFRTGEYFRRTSSAATSPPFLDDITVRFGVSDPEGHYHVPLLLSPFGYSTYRGS